jgi:transcriptional regulator with XRE-family HTH domain
MRKKPNPEDIAIGERVRSIRVAQGVSQSELGEACGVSYQQIQKYETGANRLSITRGLVIARVLNSTIAALAGQPAPSKRPARPAPSKPARERAGYG